MVPGQWPWVSFKNVGQFGPAVGPPKTNKYL